MYDYVGQIVRAQAGHDKGGLFCVTGTEDSYLLLADGKRRSAMKPKRKKCGHVSLVGTSGHPALQKVRSGQPVSDRELRRALAAVRDEFAKDQGGN